MKTNFLILISSIFALANAQPNKPAGEPTLHIEKIESSQVPEGIVSKFATTFTGATAVRWEKHSVSDQRIIYVAVFTEGGVRSRARYKEDGTALSSSKYFGPQKLPANIKSAATTKYPDFTVMGGQEITTRNGKTYYKVRSRKGPSKIIQYFDADGNVITKDNAPDGLMEDEEDGN